MKDQQQRATEPENLYTNMSDLVKQEDIDVVFILNSDEYHTECAIEAIRNGRHVFMEKPMCLTFTEADAIIAERDRYRVVQYDTPYIRHLPTKLFIGERTIFPSYFRCKTVTA
ncbi:Gfo/Idh/MocA family protein [Paenibacillus sp. D51F]